MQDLLLVAVLEACNQASHKEPYIKQHQQDINEMVLTRGLFVEALVLADVVAQVTAVQQVHDQVERVSVLERIVHVHQEGTVQLRQNLPLVHDRLDAALREYSRLAHLLHGIQLLVLRLLPLHFPHFTEATLADAVVLLEMRLADSYQTQIKDRSGIE